MTSSIAKSSMISRDCAGEKITSGSDIRAPVCVELRLALEHRLQIGAVDQLHRQVVLPVRLAEIVGARDVGVRDAPRKPHLTTKALDRRLVRRDAEVERLQRDDVADHRVERPIARAHAAASDQLLDAIAPREEPDQPAVHRWCRAGRAERVLLSEMPRGHGNIMWGDAGKLFWWISAADLKAARFGRARFELHF